MDANNSNRSKRFAKLAERDINKEVFVSELPELGLIVMDSPGDPKPSLIVQGDRVIEMDGKPADDFDAIDRFIVERALNLDRADEAMALGSLKIARMLVDIETPQRRVMEVFSGLTPAMMTEVMSHLNVVEMLSLIHI